MATYRPDGTRIRKRDKKKNRGNVGVGTSAPEGNVGVGSSAPSSAPSPGPIVSDDRDAGDKVGVGVTH
jgi:hypothetical protein